MITTETATVSGASLDSDSAAGFDELGTAMRELSESGLEQ